MAIKNHLSWSRFANLHCSWPKNNIKLSFWLLFFRKQRLFSFYILFFLLQYFFVFDFLPFVFGPKNKILNQFLLAQKKWINLLALNLFTMKPLFLLFVCFFLVFLFISWSVACVSQFPPFEWEVSISCSSPRTLLQSKLCKNISATSYCWSTVWIHRDSRLWLHCILFSCSCSLSWCYSLSKIRIKWDFWGALWSKRHCSHFMFFWFHSILLVLKNQDYGRSLSHTSAPMKVLVVECIMPS